METLQAHFLNQLQKMGSKYYKVLPVNFDEISAKKVKCHLVVVNGDSSSFKKYGQEIGDTGKVYRIGGRFNFIKCEQMVIRYAEQRFRMPRKGISGLRSADSRPKVFNEDTNLVDSGHLIFE